MIAPDILTEENLRVFFDDVAIDDLLLAAEINGAVGVHSAAVEAGDPLAEMEAAAVLLALLKRLMRPARIVTLQNRDRSTPAMIAQMTQIASGPDYYRVAPTKEFASGTPIVFGNDNILPPGAAIGRQDKAVAANGQRFAVRYVVVEAGDILTSNKADGTAIPAYEGGAYGKLRAIAGNGRLAGLIEGFARGTTADYVRELAEDEAHGIGPTAIAQFARPVLVRVMNQEDVTENIGDISNQKGTSDLSPVEQAQNDSKRLNLADLDINDDGSPSEAAALAFIAAMPESERNNLMDGKRPGQKAYDRLMATVFWKAYGDAELVRLYAQSVDPEVKTILGGMASASGDLAKLDGAGELDVRGLVTQAAALAVNAKRQGVKLALFAQQADMTLDPDTMRVVRMFAENIRSAKKIGERLRAVARFAYEEFTKEDNDMFGAVEKASREQVLAQLEKPTEATDSALFDAVGGAPTSWLGYKIINTAAAADLGAAVLPSANALAGEVWCALRDATDEPLNVPGTVVGVTFTASKVSYSVAFPIAMEGLLAVVDGIPSELVTGERPADGEAFDSVLSEASAKLFADPDCAIYDAIDPLVELELSTRLMARTEALQQAGEDDPLATLTISGEILAIIAQLEEADVPDVVAEPDPLASAKARLTDAQFKKLTADFTRSLSVIKGVDEGTERGWDRALFVSSIVGKIKTQAKNDPELAGMLLAWLSMAQGKFAKPAVTARNGVWSAAPGWERFSPLFGGAAPAAPLPVVAAPAPADVPAPAAESAPAAMLVGNELGEFADTPEGKAELRKATKAHFEAMLGQFVPCPALGGDVELRKSGMNKMLSLSGDERKLKLVPALKAMIGAAKKVSTAPPYDRAREPNVVAYHTMRSAAVLAGTELAVRFVIKEDDKGAFHWDHTVHAAGAVFDSVETAKGPDESGPSPAATSDGGAGRTGATHLASCQLDSIVGQSSEVFNLFIEGEAPEEVQEEDDTPAGPSEQFESYRAYIEKQLAEGQAVPPGMLEQIAADERLNDGEAEQLAALAAAPNPFDPFSPVWERPLDEITGMTEQQYSDALLVLTAANHHAEVLVMEAARTGDMMLRHHALELLREQQREGSLTADIKRRSEALRARISAANVPAMPEQTPQQEVTMETLIKIAAESIGQLRRIDVYRVLESAGDRRAELATFIATNRADLVREVTEVMAEEWPALGWAMPAAEPTVIEREHGELLAPEKDGAPKELTIPPVPEAAEVAPAPNPQRAADMAFLNSVVSRSVDMWADDLADKIEAMAATYEGDAEMEKVWGDAIVAYTDFMAEAMTAG